MKVHSLELLQKTKEFWDGNPCDGQNGYKRRAEFRFKKEPWLLPLLDEIAQHHSILEVGCGQGTDAIYCCQRLEQDSSYTAIDISPRSIEKAIKSTNEIRSTLVVEPVFQALNSEQLDFNDNSFDCVFSIGVLHHTPNMEKALEEIYRVLKKDGVVIIAVYRLFSLKLLVALFSRFFIKITGSRKIVMCLLKKIGSNHFLGTMLLECAGVPILRSYTKRSLEKKFKRFKNVDIKPIGIGFNLFGLNNFIDNKLGWFGAMLLVRAFK